MIGCTLKHVMNTSTECDRSARSAYTSRRRDIVSEETHVATGQVATAVQRRIKQTYHLGVYAR